MTERTMASNRIQFQHGISLPEFVRSFGTEAQCAEAVKAVRWPDGFVCPRCGCAEHYVVGHGVRKLFQCNARQKSSCHYGSRNALSTVASIRHWVMGLMGDSMKPRER